MGTAGKRLASPRGLAVKGLNDPVPGAGFLRPTDPFGRTASLVFRRSFPVLGVPLLVRSNAEGVVMLATKTFADWGRLPPSLIGVSRSACLDVIVQPATDDVVPGRLTYRRHGPVFMAGAGPVLASVLLDQGHAVAFVPAQALGDDEWFGFHVLGLAWLLVSRFARVPLHAAGIVRNGCALLLLADSGRGKSTLTYACRVAGFGVLSEDAVFVDLGGGTARLWGSLSSHWLAEDTVAFFPEIARHPVVRRANGKTRIRVPGDGHGGAPLLTTDAPVAVVVLSRHGGPASLVTMDGDDVAGLIERDDTEGFDQYPAERPAIVAWLRTRPAFRLEIGEDPHAAAAMLRELVDAQREVGLDERALTGRLRSER